MLTLLVKSVLSTWAYAGNPTIVVLIFFQCINDKLTLADNPCCSCLATYFGKIPFANSSQPNNKVHLALT